MALSPYSPLKPVIPVKPRYHEVTTEPTQEPIVLEDARLWGIAETESQVSGNLHRDDELVRSIVIPAVRRVVEGILGESLITQTRTAYFDACDLESDRLYLPYGPLQSVDHVKYTVSSDTSTLETFDSDSYYIIDGKRSLVVLNEGYTWPTDLAEVNSLQVQYVAGYGASSIGTPDYKDTEDNGTGDYLLATGGTFGGCKDVTFKVTCDATTSFKASNNADVNFFTSTETITGLYQHLQLGCYIKFPATTGYAVTDYWEITCTGNDVPERYQNALLQLVKYIMSADAGYVNERLNQIIETTDIPPAIRVLLGTKVKI